MKTWRNFPKSSTVVRTDPELDYQQISPIYRYRLGYDQILTPISQSEPLSYSSVSDFLDP